jgi:hypothetical protein
MIFVVAKILGSSVINLFTNQPDILAHTSQTTMTEWNFAHHLANEIAKYIFWLNNDIDVTKRNYRYRRPDIIFHRRGTHTLNFLVVEIKCNNNNESDINYDIRKIKKDWMQKTLSYRFGTSIIARSKNDWAITIFERGGSKIKTNSKDFKDLFPIPENCSLVSTLQCFVNQTLAKKKQNPDADTSELEKKIDELVYKLYGLTEEEIKIVEGGKT